MRGHGLYSYVLIGLAHALSIGCAAFDKGAVSPSTQLEATATVPVDVAPELNVGSPTGVDSEASGQTTAESGGDQGDVSTGGLAGKIGGNGDSIALWMAIGSLGVLGVTLTYPGGRITRLAWQHWRSSCSSQSPPNDESTRT